MLNKRTNSDGVIIHDVLRGNRQRFDGLVERHYAAVYATALAYTRDSGDAEDVVQDTFLKAFTSLDTLRSPGKFGSWVLTIARNNALSFLRGKKATDELDEKQTANDSPGNTAQRKEFYAFLSEAITDLPDGDREAILLHYFSGKSAREVAQSLGVSRSAVLKRLERGRSKLGTHLLERMGDEETVREAFTPSIQNVIRGIAATAVGWKVSNALTAGGVMAASLSFLPKASTVAAALLGVTFTTVVGYSYLKSNSVDEIDAARESSVASTTTVSGEINETVPAEAEESPQPLLMAMKAESNGEEDSTVSDSAVASDGNSDDTENSFSTIDGFWDLTAASQGAPHSYFGRVEFSGAGGGLSIVSTDIDALEMIQTITRTDRAVEINLGDTTTVHIPLSGEFNPALTKLTLNGTLYDLENDLVDGEIEIIGTRVSDVELNRSEQIEAFKAELVDLFSKIKAYRTQHTGAYPETLETLHPHFVHDQNEIETNDERTIVYQIPPEPVPFDDIAPITAEVMSTTDPDVAMELERHLQQLWGDDFVNKTPVLESVHNELNIRFRVSVNGAISEKEFDENQENLSSAATTNAPALRASCANNLKQLGLSCKMFENEQALSLFPPGWRVLYPEYLSDVRVLTCPSAEPGTESYEILIPASNSAFMEEWAVEIEQLPEGTSSSVLQDGIPFVYETHECSGSKGRNILFLDGHVKFYRDGEWEKVVDPYRQK